MKKVFFLILFTAILWACVENKKKGNVPETEPEVVDKMTWWREAKFGMFIHWGLYAIPAGEYNGRKEPHLGEWIMNNLNIPINEYEKFATTFNPVKFDADEWVSIAKNAGMKYIVITSKHHDGFCLWDSKITEWDIMDASPYKRDILKELAEACKKQDIKLCFYHSIMDWHHQDAQGRWEPNYNQDFRSEDYKVNPNFQNYYQNYLKPQIKELITEYGDVGLLWFDGEWIPDYTSEMGKELYNYILELKPDMIVNNRVDKGRQGMNGMNAEGEFAGDFGTPEQEIPDTGIAGKDWESCMTMNDTWGYEHFDDNWKSDTLLIHNLIDVVSKGGNFLLNVGPTAEGVFPEPSVKLLNAMGEWLKVNGESVYGAGASPFDKPEWGRYTQKEDKIFMHIFEWPSNGIVVIDSLEMSIEKAYSLADNATLEINKTQKGYVVSLPEKAIDGIVPVIVLEKSK